MPISANLNRKERRDTPLDVSDNIVVHERIGSDLMGYYSMFPCKISACLLIYVVRGRIKVSINLGEYLVHEKDFVVLVPGSFIQFKEVSEDTLISFEGYSSSFLKKINFWKTISPIIQHVFKQPVFSLDDRMAAFYRESFQIMSKLSVFDNSFMTHSIAQSALVVAIEMLANAINAGMVKGISFKNSSRDQAIVSEFMQLALENYRTEHKISFYAHEASLTLSHFCNVISKATGMTAQQIIMNLIIMDAKDLLMNTDFPVHEIAQILGFSSPTTFNRYFKTYTAMTPQEYRNSIESL